VLEGWGGAELLVVVQFVFALDHLGSGSGLVTSSPHREMATIDGSQYMPVIGIERLIDTEQK